MKKRTGHRKSSKLKLINLVLWGLYVPLLYLFLMTMYRYNVLQFRHLNHLVTLVLVLVVLGTAWMMWAKKARLLTTIVLFIALIGTSVGTYGIQELVNFSQRLNSNASFTEYEMLVLVPAESDITDVRQVSNVLVPEGYDQDNIQALMDDIAATKKVELARLGTTSYLTAYQAMLNGEAPAMVLNSVFTNFLENEDPEFSKKVRKIYSLKRTQKVGVTGQQISGDSFNIYISGIDTYGPISSVSRSDVNIIMTVNRTTHKVLLTTTPRDAYVPIADGGQGQYDKLTHAGIYGVEASVHTLESLYGIDISNYVRLNFTSFLKLIDLVGGIEVYNDQEFTSLQGNYHFSVGEVTMNADQALGFVRERYALSNGDNDRGKNQEKVIAALIKKLSMPQNLKNYKAILTGLEGSVQTDLSLETIMGLINSQLETGQAFTVESQALTGSGRTDLPSYAMPGYQLYMMEINQVSLEQVKSKMQEILAVQ